jgi:hypothetical protein
VVEPKPPDADAALVVASTREPTPAGDERLQAAARGVRNWSRVIALAAEHGVVGHVRVALAGQSAVVPAWVSPRLRDAELAGIATVMTLNATLGRVLAALRARDIEALILKGPVLAGTLYADPTLRPYHDLDLCVRRPELDAAAGVLLDLGFAEVPYAAEVARSAVAAAGGEGAFHRLFMDPGRRALIELHADPLQLGLLPAAEDDRWARALPAPRFGPGAFVLADDDQLLHLCVHAHKHGFSRLIWLKDLDLFIRRNGMRIDWRLVDAVARKEGVRASIWYALLLTSEILGTPEPAAARAMAPAGPIRFLYKRVWPAVRIEALGAGMRRRAVQFHVAESWRGTLPTLVLMGRRRDRARLVLRSLLSRSTETQPASHGGRTG